MTAIAPYAGRRLFLWLAFLLGAPLGIALPSETGPVRSPTLRDVDLLHKMPTAYEIESHRRLFDALRVSDRVRGRSLQDLSDLFNTYMNTTTDEREYHKRNDRLCSLARMLFDVTHDGSWPIANSR